MQRRKKESKMRKLTVKKKSQIFTALVTPFCEDKSIDWKAFQGLVEGQVEAAVDGLVLCGTTGEAPALTVSEKISLIKRAKALAGDDLHIMAGSGSSNTEQSVELSKLCLDAGADSLLVVTPPYNKPSLSGLVAHFEAIATAAKAPMCLYHVPGRTAQRLTASEMKEICQIDNFFSVKEASADLSLFSKVVQVCPDKKVFSGDDPTYLPSLSVGGLGCISVLTNIFPKPFVAMTKAFEQGEVARATEIHNTLYPFIQALFSETNPCPLKAALNIAGLCKNLVRLPLDVVLPSNYNLLEKLFRETNKRLEELAS